MTSAGGREGRTTTAANLAVAMAQAGLNVVLIDADLRDPRLHTVFGNDNTTGLTSVLAGEVTLKQALQETSVQGLRLLTAGAPAGNAGDLLAESRLRPLLDAVAATCDLVILDSAPVLSVSDPIALAAVCDHVLLVGDYRRTTRRYVARAMHELADVVHGNVSGVLLNAPRRAGGLVPNGRPQHAGAKAIAGTGEIAPAVTGSAPDAGATAIAGTGEVAPAVTVRLRMRVRRRLRVRARLRRPRLVRLRRRGCAGATGAAGAAGADRRQPGVRLAPATAGHDRAQPDHPSGAEVPAQARDRRRRLIRRG